MRVRLYNTAQFIDDMDLPGYSLHLLKGKRKNCWSIKVSCNWRITFEDELYEKTKIVMFPEMEFAYVWEHHRKDSFYKKDSEGKYCEVDEIVKTNIFFLMNQRINK